MTKNIERKMLKGALVIDRKIKAAGSKVTIAILCKRYGLASTARNLILDNIKEIAALEAKGVSFYPYRQIAERLITAELLGEAEKVIDETEKIEKHFSSTMDISLFLLKNILLSDIMEKYISQNKPQKAENLLRSRYPHLEMACLEDGYNIAKSWHENGDNNKGRRLLQKFADRFAKGDIGMPSITIKTIMDEGILNFPDIIKDGLDSSKPEDKLLIAYYHIIIKGNYDEAFDLGHNDFKRDNLQNDINDDNINYILEMLTTLGELFHKNQKFKEAEGFFELAYECIRRHGFNGKVNSSLDMSRLRDCELAIAKLIKYKPENAEKYRWLLLDLSKKIHGYEKIHDILEYIPKDESYRKAVKSIIKTIQNFQLNFFNAKAYCDVPDKEAEFLNKAYKYAMKIQDKKTFFSKENPSVMDGDIMHSVYGIHTRFLEDFIEYYHEKKGFEKIIPLLRKHELSSHLVPGWPLVYRFGFRFFQNLFNSLIVHNSPAQVNRSINSLKFKELKNIGKMTLAKTHVDAKKFNKALEILQTLEDMSFESALIELMPALIENIKTGSEYNDFVEACLKQSASVADCFEAV